ncbi:UbiA family prenyltransferase [Cellulomonas sp. P22]|uniref:UbiA family prenyltransferase n=1 Tax=Cellulomonas sp. P22 TaxID=3373189 RepID=UPI0037A6FAFF
MRALLGASHPAPTVAVTALATALAIGVGSPVRTWWVLGLAVLAGQLSVGWSNDWLDAARDTAVARTDKPLARGAVRVAEVRTAAFVALLACVLLSAGLGWWSGGLHLVAVASAWAYNLRLKGTVWSWLPYAVSFGLIPVFVVGALPGAPVPPWWAPAGGALLGVGAHLANVVPDLEDDASTGVRGLPHRWGPRVSSLVACAALVTATGCLVLGRGGAPGAAGLVGLAVAAALAVAACTVAVLRPRSRVPFLLVIAVAGVDVVLLVAAGRLLP